AEHAELEVGDGKQRVLLIAELLEIPDLTEIGVVLEPDGEIRAELFRQPRRRGEVGLAIFSEADIDDRVDDELVVALADADDGADLHPEPGLREFRRRVRELEVD